MPGLNERDGYTVAGNMNMQKARQELVEIGKMIYAKGMVAANDGNISIRLDDERILITPSGVSKGFMKAEEMVALGLDGTIISNHKSPSSESNMHLEIYKNRPDVNSVCHAHPPYATAFATAGISLPSNILPEVAISLGEIPVVEYATPGTEALAAALRPYLKEHVAFLLANHGAVTIGDSAMQAYYRMEIVEHAAKIIYLAGNLGQPATLSTDQIEELKNAYSNYTNTNLDEQELVNEITRDVLEKLKSLKRP